MRTLEQRLSYERLELLPQSPSSRSHAPGRMAYAIRTYLLEGLTQFFLGSREPKIWSHTDKNGQQLWYARDPKTQYVTQLNSENEVRVWLENRFHV